MPVGLTVRRRKFGRYCGSAMLAPHRPGYIGDEDNGEMSAWFIFSAMGFYPLNMGNGELVFGSPLFKKITLHHENGHDLIIEAPNNSSTNIYVGGLTINGTPYSKTSIKQTDLTDQLKTQDVVLHFDMQATPAPGVWVRMMFPIL